MKKVSIQGIKGAFHEEAARNYFNSKIEIVPNISFDDVIKTVENGQSDYWIKNSDVLIVSQVPDQFGNPRYQIVIYFVRHLEQLIATERKERQEKARERTQSGKTAF